MGCFWKPSEELLKVDGVIDTAAGYTGNPSFSSTIPPKYDDVCFGQVWVEGVRVIYDDETISYQELLEAFFEAQEPKINSRQYASIIFPHDKEQEEIASSWLQQGIAEKRVREKDGMPLSITTLEPLSRFFKAEGYHQRYWQKFRPRVAAVVGLIALQMLPLDMYVTPGIGSTIHSAVDWSLKLIAVFVILERLLDTKVEELWSVMCFNKLSRLLPQSGNIYVRSDQ